MTPCGSGGRSTPRGGPGLRKHVPLFIFLTEKIHFQHTAELITQLIAAKANYSLQVRCAPTRSASHLERGRPLHARDRPPAVSAAHTPVRGPRGQEQPPAGWHGLF